MEKQYEPSKRKQLQALINLINSDAYEGYTLEFKEDHPSFAQSTQNDWKQDDRFAVYCNHNTEIVYTPRRRHRTASEMKGAINVYKQLMRDIDGGIRNKGEWLYIQRITNDGTQIVDRHSLQ